MFYVEYFLSDTWPLQATISIDSFIFLDAFLHFGRWSTHLMSKIIQAADSVTKVGLLSGSEVDILYVRLLAWWSDISCQQIRWDQSTHVYLFNGMKKRIYHDMPCFGKPEDIKWLYPSSGMDTVTPSFDCMSSHRVSQLSHSPMAFDDWGQCPCFWNLSGPLQNTCICNRVPCFRVF